MRFDPSSGRRSTLLALTIVAALLLGVAPPAGAAVIDVNCSADPGALQPALDAAEPDDVVEIRGRCVGTFSVPTSLSLRGSGTLDGAGDGPVLYVDAFNLVTVENLAITGGDEDLGGGIYVEFFAHLVLEGSASVRGNTAALGGGIFAAGSVEIRDSATVRDNAAEVAGGGIYDRSGVTMYDRSSVVKNVARSGGGIYVVEFRGLELRDAASISGNRAARSGGGIAASIDTEVSIAGEASVSGNLAEEEGGGIESAGNLMLGGSASVNGNTAGTKTAGGRGGGIFSTGAVTLREASKVQGNKAIGPGADGGGIYHVCDVILGGGTVTLDGGRVKSNKPNDIVTLPGDCVAGAAVTSTGKAALRGKLGR